MKNMILILSVLFFFTGCNEEETKPVYIQDNSIYGTWQRVEEWFGLDGDERTNFGWNLVSDFDGLSPFVFTFNKDNTFSSDIFQTCIGQTFDINSDSLILYFKCTLPNNKSEKTEEPYKFTIENGELTLIPAYLFCHEGCGSKFKKIAL